MHACHIVRLAVVGARMLTEQPFGSIRCHILSPQVLVRAGLSLKVLLQELNFETADDRFSAQKLIIQAGDQEDRHVDKRKRRERKLKKKLKKKEAAAEEQSPGAVVLGGGGDSAGEQSDQSDEEDMGREKPVQKARRAAGAYKGMADDDSDQPNSPVRAVKDMGLGDQEQLALRLLAGGM